MVIKHRYRKLNCLLVILLCAKSVVIYSQTSRIDSLWNQTVSELLKSDISFESFAYDAPFQLMVPMFYAFETNDQVKINEFDVFFTTFFDNRNAYYKLSMLHKMQFLFFFSQYLQLKTTVNNSIVHEIAWVNLQIDSVWYIKPIWQWKDKSLMSGELPNLKAKIDYKLNNKDLKEITYKRVILDQELLFFGVVCNLVTIYKQKQKVVPPLLQEIQQKIFEIINRRGLYDTKGYWVFQKGYWADHKDYLYAGHSVITKNMQPKPVEGIGEDISHFHRMPLLLTVYRNSFEQTSFEFKQIDSIIQNINKSFFDRLLYLPTDMIRFYRLVNFQDGTNGVYRYNYSTYEKGTGNEPFQLSGILFLGWYTFLGSTEIKQVYKNLSRIFPLNDSEMAFFQGKSNREVHPIIKLGLKNGLKELQCILASKIIR